MWGAGARTGLMRCYQRRVVRVVTSSLAIRMSPGQQRESRGRYEAMIQSGLASRLTLRDYNHPGHRTGTLQGCRQAADDKSDRTQWVSLLCSVSGYVTHNWASQDPGHYGDITMPWHSYTGHPGTFYLSWITCSCETCAPHYPVPTLAPEMQGPPWIPVKVDWCEEIRPSPVLTKRKWCTVSIRIRAGAL